MLSNPSPEYLAELVEEFRNLPQETEWLEFKVNNSKPQEVGEYVSALSNSAALHGVPSAYLIWGVEDGSHRVVGTQFSLSGAKISNEELENWLLQRLSPRINFRFFSFEIDGHTLVLLEIAPAFRSPVRFSGVAYIRVGSYKKNLKDFPEKERELWRGFDTVSFEEGIAKDRLSPDEMLDLLDYHAYFGLTERPVPGLRESILKELEDEGLVHRSQTGGWCITNLGAVLFAKRLASFPTLERKAVRVIRYEGDTKLETASEQIGKRGYASKFEGLIDYINGVLPSKEVIGQALRKSVPVYPSPAVRELVVNALIHQDFSLTGAGPMIEVFDNRVEVTNPGIPLISTDRFVNNPPKSRNEKLALMMRKLGICEERGSGIDKVVFHTEDNHLPPPIFEQAEESTRAVLWAPRPLAKMDKTERIRACYLHACLKWVSGDFLTNTSIRERFEIEPQNKAAASRHIKEAVEAGAIRTFNESEAPRLRKYVPFWA